MENLDLKAARSAMLEDENRRLCEENLRLQAEVARRKAAAADAGRQQLQDFFMQVPVPLVILEGSEHRVTLANPLFERLVGKDLKGKTVAEAFPLGETTAVVPHLNDVYVTGRAFVGKEMPLQLPDEHGNMQKVLVDVGYHAYRAPGGEIKGLIALVQDVTERAKARENIRDQSLWLEEVLNRLPIGLVMAEPGTAKYRFTNKAAKAMLGQAPNGDRLDLSPGKIDCSRCRRKRLFPSMRLRRLERRAGKNS